MAHCGREVWSACAVNEDNNSIDIPSFFGIIGHFVFFFDYGKKKIEKWFFKSWLMTLTHFLGSILILRVCDWMPMFVGSALHGYVGLSGKLMIIWYEILTRIIKSLFDAKVSSYESGE